MNMVSAELAYKLKPAIQCGKMMIANSVNGELLVKRYLKGVTG